MMGVVGTEGLNSGGLRSCKPSTHPSAIMAPRLGWTPHRSLVAPQYQRLMDVTHKSIGVPAVMPAGGVAIFGTKSNGVNPILIYVRQAKPVPGVIPASKAAANARYFGGSAGQKVTKVVFGAVTDPSSIPLAGAVPPKSALINRPAWMVMLSYPRPHNHAERLRGRTQWQTHGLLPLPDQRQSRDFQPDR